MKEVLEEMWAALTAYQPQADKAAHGASWAKMCREKTSAAAVAAAYAAYTAAYYAEAEVDAYAAASAASYAADAASYAEVAYSDYAAEFAQKAVNSINSINSVISVIKPPQRKPLTEQQIVDLCDGTLTTWEQVRIARAIEAAHGIKENTCQ